MTPERNYACVNDRSSDLSLEYPFEVNDVILSLENVAGRERKTELHPAAAGCGGGGGEGGGGGGGGGGE